MIYTLKEVVE